MPDPSPVSPTSTFSSQRVLVTGATSGLGFEAAAQLAELGYGSVVFTARTADKAIATQRELVERTGRTVFDSVVVDVASIASSRRATAELIERNISFDAVVLNAGMVASELAHTDEGIELTFGSSIVGHHIIATELIGAGRLADGARVILVGSEAANNDLPRMMGLKAEDFALEPPVGDAAFQAAIKGLARGESTPFDANKQYATTKVVSAWWAAEMQRRHGGAVDFFTVSPGANVGTDAARNTKGAFKVMIAVMARVGHLIGMNMPVPEGARRYVDVVTASAEFEPGRTYTSKPKKMVGDLVVRDEPHLVDPRRQALAISSLDDLIAEVTAGMVGS